MTTSLTFPAAAVVKAGAKCSKAGITAINSNKTFTCVKSGKKLVWYKGIKKTSSNFQFKTYCDSDPLVPNEWKEFQENAIKRRTGCLPPYRYVISELTKITPISVTTSKNEFLPIENCKLTRSSGYENQRNRNLLLNPNTSVIVLPFQTPDFPTNRDPRVDWGQYFSWIQNSLENMTDVPSNYKFDIAPEYFVIESNMRSFGLSGAVAHGAISANSDRYKLINEVIKKADQSIDFSKYDYVFFVSPLTVPRQVLANQIAYGNQIFTGEKTFEVNGYITSKISDFNSQYWISREPFSFIHEMMHIFNTVNDEYGNLNEWELSPDDPNFHYGVGGWGNMSGALTDHLVWDKWTAKMVSDRQVICANSNSTSIVWIKPSTIKGEHEKLLLIPLNQYQAIAIESIRNSGFNYKIPITQLGALVYLIDTKKLDDSLNYKYALKVYCPTNRPCSVDEDRKFGNFALAGATLKIGDYLDLQGLRISLLESGDFGDVVKVEKVN